jgi:hypothetical protein
VVVRQHDLIAIQLRAAAAGQAPTQRYTVRGEYRLAFPNSI